MTAKRFSVNWDYRCPFARNAHEHVMAALEAGADWEVEFVPFSLSQVHVPEGEAPVWDNPDKQRDLLATEIALVVRDRMPKSFGPLHRSLFSARHEEALDLREESVLREILGHNQIDAEAVFSEVKAGWPLQSFRDAHEGWVERFGAFGVPTFVTDGDATFVRIMTRPGEDGALAERTIARVLEVVTDNPELNEIKHTRVTR